MRASQLETDSQQPALPAGFLARWRIDSTGRRGRSLGILCLAGLLAGLSSLSANPFYVSTNGKDDHDGSQAAPFRTIERAREAARAAAPNQSADIVVYLEGGRYELNDTLRFDGNDSGRNGHRVVYRSVPGDEVQISGGRQITGWTHFRDGIYRASAPVSAFRQLYINGQRGVRARTPDNGYNRISSWGDDKTIRVPANQVSNWSNLNQIEIVVNKHWHQSRLRIESIYTNGDTAYIVPMEPARSSEWGVRWPNREPNQPYFFENSLDFLDQPGEWYLDRNQQQVYYMPRPGEKIETAEIIAPRLERLLEVKGASNLDFIGLTFEHSNWTHPDQDGFIPIQANLYVNPGGVWLPSALHLEFTDNVRLERNVIRKMGGGAIALHAGTHRTQIVGNAIADVAASGISVYTNINDRNPPEHEKSRGDMVRNNYITRVGQDYPGGVGIVGTYTDGLVIEHNELFNNPYSAISVGWGWTNEDTALRNNVVRYNRIHQVMNLMDDGAGIYTLSKQPGGLYEENYIYDLTRNPWAGTYEITALYLDEQTAGITMRNNVVRNLSGVNVFKQNRVQDGLNTIHDNGPDIANADAIMANSGLEESYRDIPDQVSKPNHTEPGAFWGEPAPLPGRIEIEDFDHGGPGNAYHDATAVNEGGQYRPSEYVDIEPCLDTDGGYSIGYTASGEWLEYTVDVASSGTYNLRLRLASINSGRYFHISMDGQDVTGHIGVPNTSGWQNWQTVTIEDVHLNAGEQKLRVNFDTGDFNINWIEAEAVAVNELPVVSLLSPEDGVTFEAGDPISIAGEAIDPDGSIAKVEFLAGEVALGERSTPPFSFVWQTAPDGLHTLAVRATDNLGATAISQAVTVSVVPGREPLGGVPASIPGRILTAEYDSGGPGVAYHDTTEFNTGGAYRLEEDVDIEAALDSEADFNVGWVAAGEWINYTVDVTEPGLYNLHFRLASESSDGRFHLDFDGENKTGEIQAPNTGGWQTWTTLTLSNIHLSGGVQTMRLNFDGGEFNISVIEFERAAAVTTFEGWTEAYFTADERKDPAISGPIADPHGDGLPNLLKYALNQVPGEIDRKKLPVQGTAFIDGKPYLTLTYTRPAGLTDLDYTVERSTNLRDWTADPAKVIEVSSEQHDALVTVVIRDAAPMTESTASFLRLRVDQS